MIELATGSPSVRKRFCSLFFGILEKSCKIVKIGTKDSVHRPAVF
jgi:hypothetical protein